MSDLLTDAERRAMELTTQLVNLVARAVIGDGETRTQDINEFVRHVHGIQHMIMAQAAARAYPGEYRLLGGTV
jgi:hypothetical protein